MGPSGMEGPIFIENQLIYRCGPEQFGIPFVRCIELYNILFIFFACR